MKNATPGAKGTKCILKLTVRVFNNGNVRVDGIPTNFGDAMNLCHRVTDTIVMRFIKAAQTNQLNDDLVIDGGRIVVPKTNVG